MTHPPLYALLLASIGAALASELGPPAWRRLAARIAVAVLVVSLALVAVVVIA